MAEYMTIDAASVVMDKEPDYVDPLTKNVVYMLIPELTPDEEMMGLPPIWEIAFQVTTNGAVERICISRMAEK
jgi:hypothetical protein